MITNPTNFAVKLCAGSDPNDSDVLQIKTSVNRTYAFMFTSSPEATTVDNNGLNKDVIASILDVLGDAYNALPTMLRAVVDGHAISAGKTATVNFDRASVNKKYGVGMEFTKSDFVSAIFFRFAFSVIEDALEEKFGDKTQAIATVLAAKGVLKCWANMVTASDNLGNGGNVADIVNPVIGCVMEYFKSISEDLDNETLVKLATKYNTSPETLKSAIGKAGKLVKAAYYSGQLALTLGEYFVWDSFNEGKIAYTFPTKFEDLNPDINNDLHGAGVVAKKGEIFGDSTQWAHTTGFVKGKTAWVLSTGDVSDAIGDPSDFANTALGKPGNDRLSALINGANTHDAASYKYTLTPEGKLSLSSTRSVARNTLSMSDPNITTSWLSLSMERTARRCLAPTMQYL